MNRESFDYPVPALNEVRETATRINPFVMRTPTIRWPVPKIGGGPDTDLYVKMELFQNAGSFKARGAISAIMRALEGVESIADFPGVTTFSGGNHAIATAYAARSLGVSAKVVVPRSANPFRIERCKAYNAELVKGDSIGDLLQISERIMAEEKRMMIHPFEGIGTILGTATVGLELCEDLADLDAVVVPVGGGGLIAGVATAVKQLQPGCQVIGVEPAGACGMQQSLSQNFPVPKVQLDTIADSLGAPMHEPISFNLVRQFVDRMVTVSDNELRESMCQIFHDLKLAVEPACAASLAAFNGPLATELVGKRVALIACGSNIDYRSYCRLIDQ